MRITSVLAAIAAVIVAFMILHYVMAPSGGGVAGVTTSETSEVEVPAGPNEAGRYAKNPFTPTEPFPRADVETTDHNFGRMLFGEKGSHEFVIKNTGEGPLKLAQGYATCKCTIGDLGSDEIPPGGEGTVTVEWTPQAQSRSFSQSAIVYTNDPENPQFTFAVNGMVTSNVITQPEGPWLLGTLIEGEQKELTGHVVSMLSDQFEILSIKSSNDYVTATWEPIDEQNLAEVEGKCGYTVNVVVAPKMPVGDFTETLTVETDLPESGTITFILSGNRAGPFSMVGQGYSASQRTFNLGRMLSTDGKTHRATLFVLGNTSPIEVRFQSAEPPIVNVTVTEEDFTGDGRKKYVIDTEVPPGVVPGRYVGDTAVKLTLETTHPEAPTLEYFLTFQVD